MQVWLQIRVILVFGSMELKDSSGSRDFSGSLGAFSSSFFFSIKYLLRYHVVMLSLGMFNCPV